MHYKERIIQRLDEARWLVVCGSFLPGTPQDGLRDLTEAAHAAGVTCILDTYGAPLAQALDTRPALVKINQHEAGDLLGRTVQTPAEAYAAAEAIVSRGPQAVIITLGALGAVGCGDETFGWASPEVESLCAIGSGDALLAGIVAGLVQGQPLKDATRAGVAAGAANTLQIGPGAFERAQYEKLLQQTEALPH